MSKVNRLFLAKIQSFKDTKKEIKKDYGFKKIKEISKQVIKGEDQGGRWMVISYKYEGDSTFDRELTNFYDTCVEEQWAQECLFDAYKEFMKVQEVKASKGQEYNGTAEYYKWLDKE